MTNIWDNISWATWEVWNKFNSFISSDDDKIVNQAEQSRQQALSNLDKPTTEADQFAKEFIESYWFTKDDYSIKPQKVFNEVDDYKKLFRVNESWEPEFQEVDRELWNNVKTNEVLNAYSIKFDEIFNKKSENINDYQKNQLQTFKNDAIETIKDSYNGFVTAESEEKRKLYSFWATLVENTLTDYLFRSTTT